MKQNKIHWYDGWFYERFIAKHVNRFSKTIFSMIDRNTKVLDVGCGTGYLTLQLAGKCLSVTGIDLSIKNISIAKAKLNSSGAENVAFFTGDISSYLDEWKNKFDYAIILFVIHEVPFDLRCELIESVKQMAKKIIFADYIAPEPKTFAGKFNRLVEFTAGHDHFKGYKSYLANGGLDFIINNGRLKKIEEIKNDKSIDHIVLTSVE